MHSVQSGNGAASHVTGSSVASNTESDVDTVKDVDDVNGQDDQDDHPVANPAISPAPLQGAADGSKDGATRTHVVPDVAKMYRVPIVMLLPLLHHQSPLEALTITTFLI